MPPQIAPSLSALRALRRTLTPYLTPQLPNAFTLRTTNPQPVYKSAKDIRNAPLWNPSSQKLLNVEEDEAGKLAAFRAKFGRGWDVESEGDQAQTGGDHLMDLISGQGKGTGKVNEKKKTAPKVEEEKKKKK
ncbi:hypothetical protein GQ44DRAFT_827264 [Phaeosphaeriaceae sp. PMI808]|nr:hypothetical protein GQ44DRAFT_827264 [Phaeosphaeriaceae sp. PMI808]